MLPDVPTAAEAGVRGFNAASCKAPAAPARTPPAVNATLNAAVKKALADINATPEGGTPEQLSELLGAKIKRWGVSYFALGSVAAVKHREAIDLR